jgi:hypothetical protein
MIDFEKLNVVCNCGRSTILVWISTIPGEGGNMGAYVPQDVAFVYKDNSGWTCGIEGHAMKSLAGMTQGDYHKAVMEASERSKEFNGQ